MDDYKVYIVFTANSSFIGKAIRFFTRGDVSHALCLFRMPELGWYVMEADFSGFVFIPLEDITSYKRKSAFELLDPRFKSGVLRRLSLHLQVGYDYLSIIEWAYLGVKNRLLGYDKYAPKVRNTDRLYCSEAIAEALIFNNVPGFHTQSVNPEQLEAQCEKSPAVRQVSMDELNKLLCQ